MYFNQKLVTLTHSAFPYQATLFALNYVPEEERKTTLQASLWFPDAENEGDVWPSTENLQFNTRALILTTDKEPKSLDADVTLYIFRSYVLCMLFKCMLGNNSM